MMTDIDQLGTINQQIAELEATARKLKQALIARGVGKYSGADFVAEVQHYDRATINPILVKEFADEDFVAKVTQVKPVDAVVVKRLVV
jgi:PHP family Zn ribbon phosphoesterase